MFSLQTVRLPEIMGGYTYRKKIHMYHYVSHYVANYRKVSLGFPMEKPKFQTQSESMQLLCDVSRLQWTQVSFQDIPSVRPSFHDVAIPSTRPHRLCLAASVSRLLWPISHVKKCTYGLWE